MTPTRTSWPCLVDLLLLATGLVVLATCVSFFPQGDGLARYHAVEQLAQQGHLTTPPKYSLLGPLCSLPLYKAGTIVGAPLGCTSRYNLLLLILGLAALYKILRPHLPPRTLHAFMLLLLTGSLFTNHIRFFHGEVFTAVLVAAGLASVCLRPHPRRWTWGWGAAALGVANTPATLLALALASLRHVWTSRRLRALLAIPLAVALILIERRLRLGGWWESGYANDHGIRTFMPHSGLPGFSYPFWLGLLGILFSFGKGLLWFAPGLLLPVWRRWPGETARPLRECHTLFLLFLAGMVLVYAKWWSWYGGWSFGPRFFVFASIPASLALAVYATTPSPKLSVNLLVLTLLTLSLWVGACGAVFDLDTLATLGPAGNYQSEPLVWHVPEFSVIWRPFIEHRALHSRDILVLLYAATVLTWLAAPLATRAAQQSLTALQHAHRHLHAPWRW